MFPEVVWTTAPIIAHVTCVLLFFVYESMFRQIIIHLEAFATYVAYPGSTAIAVKTMCMFLRLGYGAEGFIAVVTLIRAESQVNTSNVQVQFGSRDETRSAHVAHLLRRSVRQLMIFKIAPVFEFLTTLGTREVSNIRVHGKVRFELVILDEILMTNVAPVRLINHILCRVCESHML